MTSSWAESDVKLTRDLRSDPDYVTYSEWRSLHPETGSLKGGPSVIYRRASRTRSVSDGLIAVVVTPDIARNLKFHLDQYTQDLQDAGYSVEMSIFSTAGTVEALRAYLAERLNSGLVGAVLVGDQPVPWFQLNDDWNDNGIFDLDEEQYEEFPCDLYLSDLDGEWRDDSVYAGPGPMNQGSDGVFDSHTGPLEAEIWVARIDASSISYDSELDIYADYFERVHGYRQETFRLPSKGLFYIDQDWSQGYYDTEMNLVTEDYEEIRDTFITDAKDYRSRIKEQGLFLTVCVHSSPEAHYFQKANIGYADMVYNWEICVSDPKFGFYNLFACSNCRWVETNCMGSVYNLFGNGLAVVGSTKTGSMLHFSFFNQPLAEGYSWGDAFRVWTNYWLTFFPDFGSAKAWFMGMCLLGDATLEMRGYSSVTEPEEFPPEPIVLETKSLFQDMVSVQLGLPQSGMTRVDVFDASGRLFENLCNEILNEGEYTFTFDAPAGVYFVRVSTPFGAQSKKVVVMQ